MDGLALAGRFPAFVERVLSAVAFAASGRSEEALAAAVQAIDECSSSYEKGRVLAALVEEKLRLSADGPVMLAAIELVAMAVGNLGVDFARCLDEKFMRTMTKILKMTTLKKSLSRDVKSKINKLLTGSQSCNPGVATDPQLHRLKRKVLYLLQLWHDSFVMQQEKLPAIFEAYRKLRAKGVEFPTVDVSMKFMVKNAEVSDFSLFVCLLRSTIGDVLKRYSTVSLVNSSSKSGHPLTSFFFNGVSFSSSPAADLFSVAERMRDFPTSFSSVFCAFLSFFQCPSVSSSVVFSLACVRSLCPLFQLFPLIFVLSLSQESPAFDPSLRIRRPAPHPPSSSSFSSSSSPSSSSFSSSSSPSSSSFSSSSRQSVAPYNQPPPPPALLSADEVRDFAISIFFAFFFLLSLSSFFSRFLLSSLVFFERSLRTALQFLETASRSPQTEHTLAFLASARPKLQRLVESLSADDSSLSENLPRVCSLLSLADAVDARLKGDKKISEQDEKSRKDEMTHERKRKSIDASPQSPHSVTITNRGSQRQIQLKSSSFSSSFSSSSSSCSSPFASAFALPPPPGPASAGATSNATSLSKSGGAPKSLDLLDLDPSSPFQSSSQASSSSTSSSSSSPPEATLAALNDIFRSVAGDVRTPALPEPSCSAFEKSGSSQAPSFDSLFASNSPPRPPRAVTVVPSSPGDAAHATQEDAETNCRDTRRFEAFNELVDAPFSAPVLAFSTHLALPQPLGVGIAEAKKDEVKEEKNGETERETESSHQLECAKDGITEASRGCQKRTQERKEREKMDGEDHEDCQDSPAAVLGPREKHEEKRSNASRPISSHVQSTFKSPSMLQTPSSVSRQAFAYGASCASSLSSPSSDPFSAAFAPSDPFCVASVSSSLPPSSSSASSSISSSSCSASWGFLPPPEDAPRPSAVPPLFPPPPSSSASSTSSSISSSSCSASWGFLPPPEEAHRLSAVPSLSPPPPSDAASSSSASSSS
ncbi:hypothetical protein TGDOM2_216030, partial [Toxoplasma gondii GAB2-2007-GAL-DOM2]